MAFLARLTTPKGDHHYAVNPFDHHALYGPLEKAESFPSEAHARRWYSLNVLCTGAFWESERQHARNVARQTAGWTFEVVPAAA
jgi:hypothetical protein